MAGKIIPQDGLFHISNDKYPPEYPSEFKINYEGVNSISCDVCLVHSLEIEISLSVEYIQYVREEQRSVG